MPLDDGVALAPPLAAALGLRLGETVTFAPLK
jgi:hypothetical protein